VNGDSCNGSVDSDTDVAIGCETQTNIP
jgi:hypothetical protein